MKKMLVLIMAVLMVISNVLLMTGCGDKDTTKEVRFREYHGYYGDTAWSACEEDYEIYKNDSVEIDDEISEEYINGERVYYFYTYITIAE
jgi:uncharacterized lipoprotein YehR (DUF1307 family)